MVSTRSETTSSKKAAPSKAAAAAAGTAGNGPGQDSGQAPAQTPGEIIAERYRDTAYETLVGKNGENVSAVMSAGEAMLAGMAEMSQEMMAFAGDRLRQDLETAEDFAKAKSPEELFEKQCSFAERAAQQYADETRKLITLFARIQQSCWAPVQESAKAALHGLPGTEEKEAEK